MWSLKEYNVIRRTVIQSLFKRSITRSAVYLNSIETMRKECQMRRITPEIVSGEMKNVDMPLETSETANKVILSVSSYHLLF